MKIEDVKVCFEELTILNPESDEQCEYPFAFPSIEDELLDLEIIYDDATCWKR